MTKYTFYKSNWSGESVTIHVRKDGSFDFQGERVTLVERPNSTPTLRMFGVFTDGRIVAGVIRFDGDKEWTCSSEFSGDLSRSDAVMQIAVAKLLSNI